MANGAQEGVFGAGGLLSLDSFGLLPDGKALLAENDRDDGNQHNHREHDNCQPMENNVPLLDIVLTRKS